MPRWETASEVQIYPLGAEPLWIYEKRSRTIVTWRAYCPIRRVTICRLFHQWDWTSHDRWEARRFCLSEFVKRALATSQNIGPGQKCKDEKFVKLYPAFAEFLTLEEIDGKPRQTSTISLFWQQGMFRAFLNDRDAGLSLCVCSDTFQALWNVLEKTLVSDDPGWRPIGGPGGKGKSKR